jgi:hypothetical protein
MSYQKYIGVAARNLQTGHTALAAKQRKAE